MDCWGLQSYCGQVAVRTVGCVSPSAITKSPATNTRVLLETLTGLQLAYQLSATYGPRRFIAVLITTARRISYPQLDKSSTQPTKLFLYNSI